MVFLKSAGHEGGHSEQKKCGLDSAAVQNPIHKNNEEITY